jgi:hypothetical protein
MSALTAHDSWLQAPYADDDTSASEARRDREVSAIQADPERLLDAVYEIGNDEAVKLAELRVVLHNSAGILGSLSMGIGLDELLHNADRAMAFRALIRAADDAAALVQARVLQAAEVAA